MISPAVEQAIYSKLSAATGLTSLLAAGTPIFNPVHPQAATGPVPTPYVTFQKQANTPNYVMGGGTAYEDSLYQVKAITQSTSAALAGSIAVQIDRALNGATLTITGYTPLVCMRESDIDLHEVVEGQSYQHRGAMFRIQAQPA